MAWVFLSLYNTSIKMPRMYECTNTVRDELIKYVQNLLSV